MNEWISGDNTSSCFLLPHHVSRQLGKWDDPVVMLWKLWKLEYSSKMMGKLSSSAQKIPQRNLKQNLVKILTRHTVHYLANNPRTNNRVCLFPSQLLRTFYFLGIEDSKAGNANNLKFVTILIIGFAYRLWKHPHQPLYELGAQNSIKLCTYNNILLFLRNIPRIFLADE